MKVILLERITRLGNMGDTATVKPGFARNFLFPQGKALPATAANMKKFEERRSELEATNAEQKSAAETQAKSVDGVQITIARQASETGQLYGSIKARDITDSLNAQNIDIPRSSINIGEPIKAVGEFEVAVALHPEVTATVQLTVERQSA